MMVMMMMMMMVKGYYVFTAVNVIEVSATHLDSAMAVILVVTVGYFKMELDSTIC